MDKLTIECYFDKEHGFQVKLYNDGVEVNDKVYENLSAGCISRLEYICDELNPQD